MNVDNPLIKEEFEEIDTQQSKPKIETKENVSLLDRGKGSKKQSRTNSPSPSISNSGKTHMTRDQIKYCSAIMRNLKRHRDAAPFLYPVDYVQLNIPDYPTVIRHPMDLSTVDQKLNGDDYEAVEEFINDIKLVFNNCYKFNGPEAMISMLCQNVESAFEKSLRQMPPSKPSTPLARSLSPYVDDQPKKTKALNNKKERRESTKDFTETFKKPVRKNDIKLNFCLQTLKELKKSKYKHLHFPFLQPVDVVALNIPDYIEIIKHPMDLSTIERKLKEGEYDGPEGFEKDMRLMLNNCYTYNPPHLPIYKMALELEKVFDEKWAQMPTTPPPAPVEPVIEEEEEEAEEVVESESESDERDQKIAELERHIATISQQIASMKSQKKKEKKPPVVRRQSQPKTIEKPPVKRKRTVKKATPKEKPSEWPEFTFEQKKDLSDLINNLSGDRLNTVVSIIQSSMPNLSGQGQEEIVLDIDSLDRQTLHRLHEFVTGKSLTKPVKKQRTQYAQSKKLQHVEKTLKKFNSDPDSSSESDSDSSSASDSDDSGSSSD